MTASAAPFGLERARRVGSQSNSTGLSHYRIGNGLATNLFYGDPVMFSGGNDGTIVLASTSAALPLGVFYGAIWQDPNLDGQPRWTPYWPASTSSADSTPWGMVCDDPFQTYYIQGDASVSIGDIQAFEFDTSISAGSTVNGRSRTSLNAGSRAASVTKKLRVVGLKDIPGNVFGDAFTIVEVRFSRHVYATPVSAA